LESLFDISHRDALAMIKTEKRQLFLLRGRMGDKGSTIEVSLQHCFIRKRGEWKTKTISKKGK